MFSRVSTSYPSTLSSTFLPPFLQNYLSTVSSPFYTELIPSSLYFVVSLLLFRVLPPNTWWNVVVKLNIPPQTSPQPHAPHVRFDHPATSDTIGGPALLALSLLLPCSCVALEGLATHPRILRGVATPGARRAPGAVASDVHRFLCAALCSVGAADLVTAVAKRAFGRPRPNFWSLWCAEGAAGCDPATAMDAHMSFPSNHSSVAFGGLALAAFYSLHRMRALIFGRNGGRTVRCAAVSVMAMSLAAWIGYTRIADRWHHPKDVVVGSIIGVISALASFVYWFQMTPPSDFFLLYFGNKKGD